MNKKLLIVACAFSVIFSQNVFSKYKPQKVAEGFETLWAIEFINNNEVLLNEKEGNLFRYHLKTKKKEKISGLPEIEEKGQGGLLDLALDQNFSKNKIAYITFAKKVGDKYTTALAKFRIDGVMIKDFKELYQMKPATKTGRHFGSRIVLEDEKVYFTVGDRGERPEAQKTTSDLGRVHVINKDGSGHSHVSKGNRNIQGMDRHPKTGELWAVEHGPRGGDEVNIITKGKNYGWPIISYGKEYWGPISVGEKEKEGMEQPLKYYVPSIAPCGASFYFGKRYKEWSGSFLIGALKLTHLNVLKVSNKKVISEKRYFEDLSERIRDVKVSPDDYIYFTTDNGEIYKVIP